MPPKRKGKEEKKDGGLDSSRITGRESGLLLTAEAGHEQLANSLLMADEFVNDLQKKVFETITVIETVKKIPDYNANLAVEQSFSCVWMQSFQHDDKADD